jgi:hypothetical protein
MRSLQIVAQDYFQRSEAYTHDIGSVTAASGITNLTVPIPANTRLVVPLTIFCGTDPLATTNERMLVLDYGNWRQLSDKPKFVMVDDVIGDELVLALPTDAIYTITGRVAIKPVRAATVLDDNQLEIHGDAIVDGVLHRLMMMKNTEWYEPSLAGYHRAEYERSIDEAHGVSNKANTSRIMTTGYGGS